MTTALDIHPANPDELAAAHANVFDLWSKGLPLDEHIRHRLDSPSHRRATWYVGVLDGRVVVSLGCYPVAFGLLGDTLPGIAIGSVYTVKEHRGRGFAPQLLAWVENEGRRRHAALSVLYSDIKPQYYARLGYVICPSWSGWRDLRAASPVQSTHRLVEIDPREHLSKLAGLYAEYHGTMPLSFARDEEYWRAMLLKFPSDRFYALEAAGGNWAGYVRVGRKDDTWRITDYALVDQSNELAEQLYAAFIELGRAEGAGRISGWLPDSPAARKFFELAPRQTEITMLKPLAWQATPDEAMIAGTSRFCEIDHV